MDRIYVDIITGENCQKFMLLTCTLLIEQFVHPVGGDGGIVILARCDFHFIKKNMKIWCNIQVVINPLRLK